MLHLPEAEPDLREWQALVDRVHGATEPVDVAIVGKYVHLRDAYLSVIEALMHAGFAHNVDVGSRGCPGRAGRPRRGGPARRDGRDPRARRVRLARRRGQARAIRFARPGRAIPGLCLGLQCAVIEFAATYAVSRARTVRFDRGTTTRSSICFPKQHRVVDMGATMRLGPTRPSSKREAACGDLYGEPVVHERHRHRWEVSRIPRHPAEHDAVLGAVARRPSGGDHRAARASVLRCHGSPELKSRPTQPTLCSMGHRGRGAPASAA